MCSRALSCRYVSVAGSVVNIYLLMLSNLAILSLDSNQLTGVVPDEFGALTNLTCTVQQQKPDGSCPFDDGEQARSASGF